MKKRYKLIMLICMLPSIISADIVSVQYDILRPDGIKLPSFTFFGYNGNKRSQKDVKKKIVMVLTEKLADKENYNYGSKVVNEKFQFITNNPKCIVVMSAPTHLGRSGGRSLKVKNRDKLDRQPDGQYGQLFSQRTQWSDTGRGVEFKKSFHKETGIKDWDSWSVNRRTRFYVKRNHLDLHDQPAIGLHELDGSYGRKFERFLFQDEDLKEYRNGANPWSSKWSREKVESIEPKEKEEAPKLRLVTDTRTAELKTFETKLQREASLRANQQKAKYQELRAIAKRKQVEFEARQAAIPKWEFINKAEWDKMKVYPEDLHWKNGKAYIGKKRRSDLDRRKTS